VRTSRTAGARLAARLLHVSLASQEPQTDGERQILAELRGISMDRTDGPWAYILREGNFQRRRVLTADQTAYLRAVRKRTKNYAGACWDNARRSVLLNDPESRLSYCDGKAFATFEPGGTRGHTLAHGWLLLDGVAAADLTLPTTVAFYGVVFSRKAVLEALDGAKSRQVPSLIDDWKRGWPLVRARISQ
jgi:hypothetical protein